MVKDNLLLGPVYETNVLTHSKLSDSNYLNLAVEEYETSRTGMLTNTFGDFIAFAKLPRGSISNSTRADLDSTFSADWPHGKFEFVDVNRFTL